MKNAVIIVEEANFVDPAGLEIIKEERHVNGVDKLIYKQRLQTADEVNGNARLYSMPICKSIVEALKPKAKNRSLLQEMDHPMITGDTNAQKKRAIVVEIKNCGSLIRDIRMEGKDIVAEVETLSAYHGPALRDLISKDKVNIGNSLRMFGKLQPHSKMKDINEVVFPIRPITYDTVSNPSHKSARVISFLTENETIRILSSDQDDSVIQESVELLLEDLHMPNSSQQMFTDYVYSLVRESFINMKPIQFNI